MKTRTRNRVHKQARGSFSNPGGKEVRQSNGKVLVCPVQNKLFLKTKAGRKGRERCKFLMSSSSQAWGENSTGAAYGWGEGKSTSWLWMKVFMGRVGIGSNRACKWREIISAWYHRDESQHRDVINTKRKELAVKKWWWSNPSDGRRKWPLQQSSCCHKNIKPLSAKELYRQHGKVIHQWSMNKKSVRHKLGTCTYRENTDYLGYQKLIFTTTSENPYAGTVLSLSRKEGQLLGNSPSYYLIHPRNWCVCCRLHCLHMPRCMFCMRNCRLTLRAQTGPEYANTLLSREFLGKILQQNFKMPLHV